MEAEAVHPLTLLTRDGWIHVLDRLDKPKDFWNVAHVHPLFLSIFQSDLKQKWMSAMFFGCVPLLLNYLPFPKVLELRLVDQETRSTIDQCLDQGQVSALTNYRNQVDFNSHNLIQNEDGFHLITPPITSWMNLTLMCTDVLEGFDELLPFLRQYGPQVFEVTALCLDDDGQPENMLQDITALRNLLISLPNLEVLALEVFESTEDLVVPHHCSADLMTGYLRENPLPPLPKLEYLELYLNEWPTCETSALIGTLFQCFGAQLRSLTLQWTTLILPQGLSRLRILWLELQTSEQLASVQACGSPLEVLTVVITENCPILPSQLFVALNPFQSTLKTLWLEAENWVFDQVEQVPVELPLVEKMVVKGGFSESTENDLRFLDTFPNLKELELRIVHSEPHLHLHRVLQPDRNENLGDEDNSSDEDEEEEEYLWEFHSQLLEEEHFYKSTIWTRLQKLQQVRIHVVVTSISRTFSRDTWSTTLSESRK